GLPNASDVLMAVAAGLTVSPRAASVAAGMDCARSTPAALGQVITLLRVVQTSQLLVMREPLVTLALPLVFDRPSPGVNAKVRAGPLERVLMSYLFRNH